MTTITLLPITTITHISQEVVELERSRKAQDWIED